MKARVKATGEIVRVFDMGDGFLKASDGNTYFPQGLIFIDDEPDYWEKLKHQYAGMAMQGMLSNCEFPAYSTEGYYKHNIANNAIEYATALIEKLKEG